MKILRYLVILVLVLVAAVLIAGLFAPKQQSIEKSIEIDAPASAVFLHVKYFDKYAEWNPWLKKDPEVQISTEGKDATLGAKRYWKSSSSDVGEGIDEITGIEENKSLRSQVTFLEPREGKGKNSFLLNEVEGKTRITWKFDYEIPYPWNAMNLISGDTNPMEDTFTEGLNNLRRTLESVERSAVNYVLTPVSFEGKSYVVLKKTLPLEEVNAFCQDALSTIETTMKSEDVRRKGSPTLIIQDWNEASNQMNVAFGIPITAGTKVGDLEILKVPTNDKVLMASTVGPRSKESDLHRYIKKKMAKDEKEIQFPIIEEYIRGPLSSKPDYSSPNDKVTNILYFYK